MGLEISIFISVPASWPLQSRTKSSVSLSKHCNKYMNIESPPLAVISLPVLTYIRYHHIT